MNPIQQNWINFKTHFRTAHGKLEETDEITMESAGHHQSKLVNGIIAHMSRIPFPHPPWYTEYTSTPKLDPNIVPTVQPTSVANIATDVYNILPQLLTSMKQMKQLIIQMQTSLPVGG